MHSTTAVLARSPGPRLRQWLSHSEAEANLQQQAHMLRCGADSHTRKYEVSECRGHGDSEGMGGLEAQLIVPRMIHCKKVRRLFAHPKCAGRRRAWRSFDKSDSAPSETSCEREVPHHRPIKRGSVPTPPACRAATLSVLLPFQLMSSPADRAWK